MPYSDIISPFPKFQPLIPIIPSKKFQIPYQKVLNSIDGIVTKTERRLLALLERYCYQDGQIYPKQKTLAHKLGLTIRQVQRIIKALVKKGFLAVVPAALVDRHLYGKGNHYHMLDHPVYAKMSGQMSPENQDPTFNKAKGVKNKSGFNILEWLEQNTTKHPMAVVDALKALTDKWPSIRFPGKYAQAVVDIQSGNYCAADHVAQAAQETAAIKKTTSRIAHKLGFSLQGIGQPKKETTPQHRNAQVNALLDRFG